MARDLDRPAVGLRVETTLPPRRKHGGPVTVRAGFELTGLELFLLGGAALIAWQLGLFNPKPGDGGGGGGGGGKERATSPGFPSEPKPAPVFPFSRPVGTDLTSVQVNALAVQVNKQAYLYAHAMRDADRESALAAWIQLWGVLTDAAAAYPGGPSDVWLKGHAWLAPPGEAQPPTYQETSPGPIDFGSGTTPVYVPPSGAPSVPPPGGGGRYNV